MATPQTQTPITVDGLMAAAFDRPRQPRSDAYKQGVRAGLSHHLEGASLRLPFALGTAELDACLAGLNEARVIVARIRDQEQVA